MWYKSTVADVYLLRDVHIRFHVAGPLCPPWIGLALVDVQSILMADLVYRRYPPWIGSALVDVQLTLMADIVYRRYSPWIRLALVDVQLTLMADLAYRRIHRCSTFMDIFPVCQLEG